MSLPEKAVSNKALLRRRFSKHRIANALAVARNAGMAVHELRIGVNGEIDVVFDKPANAQTALTGSISSEGGGLAGHSQ